jgi:alpha-L-rhamnosidase
MRDAQSSRGAFSDVSPRVGPTSDSAPGWADAGVIIPWTAYTQYRDIRILEENWEAMEKWMLHIRDSNPDYLWLHERGNDYGDWLAIGSDTPKDLIATAYWAYDASLMQKMALALGHNAEAKSYQLLFNNISAAFHAKYVKPDGTVGSGSQTSYVLALHMHLLSEKERAVASDKLVADVQAHDWHLTTGFLGTPYLLLELSASGHSDVAYRLLLQDTFPSWRYMIEHGATTMWERWNSDQMLGDPDMNSFNHYAYGAVAEWLYTYVAGIEVDPDDPGFHHVRMHPQFDSRLGHVEATYNSPYGAIHSAWTVIGSTTTWNVMLPPNTTALLYFPSERKITLFEGERAIQDDAELHFLRNENGSLIYEASAGSYSFSIRP